MPPPRKVDLLPEELKGWLEEALKARGFAGYEDLAEALNARLEEEGLALRIGKSAIHSYGQEYAAFVKLQDEASTWAAGWMTNNGMEEEAQRHNVLFQMITTTAFKVLKSMQAEDAKVDARDLHFLGKMLKDLMSSSGIKQKLLDDERARAARQAREAAAEEVDKVSRELGITDDTARKIRAKVLGVSDG